MYIVRPVIAEKVVTSPQRFIPGGRCAETSKFCFVATNQSVIALPLPLKESCQYIYHIYEPAQSLKSVVLTNAPHAPRGKTFGGGIANFGGVFDFKAGSSWVDQRGDNSGDGGIGGAIYNENGGVIS